MAPARSRPSAETSAPAAPPAAAAPPAPPAPEPLAKSAVREERQLADAAAAPAARAAPPAPAAPAAAARTPAESIRGAPAAPVPWESWTELRIAAAGREVVVARRRVPQLAELLNRVARMAQSTETMNQPVRQTFELSSRGTLLGVLELGDDQARWMPLAEPGPSRTARPDAATLQALREQLEAVLPR
jgi:hypothetical protein